VVFSLGNKQSQVGQSSLSFVEPYLHGPNVQLSTGHSWLFGRIHIHVWQLYSSLTVPK
jgi:hypothetical protein